MGTSKKKKRPAQRAVLEFDLTDPEAKEAFARASKATDMALALWDIYQQVLRPIIKYSEDAVQVQIYEEVRDKISQVLEENAINLDELLS